MAQHKGTSHHKWHGFTGLGLIIGLPIVIAGTVTALSNGIPDNPASGLADWLSNPLMGIGFLIFFIFAISYCKLEFDEVIMDYIDGRPREMSLLANRCTAFITILIAVCAVVKMAFLG